MMKRGFRSPWTYLKAFGISVVTSGAHILAHVGFGDATAFSMAAVTQAGITVAMASFVASVVFIGWSKR